MTPAVAMAAETANIAGKPAKRTVSSATQGPIASEILVNIP